MKVRRHFLFQPFLNYQETIALARSTKQWYRRIANVACRKFAIFLDELIDAYYFTLVSKESRQHQFTKFDSVKIVYDRLTPAAIAYYSDIGRVIWDKDFKHACPVSKSWYPDRIMKEVFLMLTRIKDHGRVDSFKAYSKVNNAKNSL